MISKAHLVIAAQEVVDSDSWVTPCSLAIDLGPFALDVASNARSHIQAARSICLPDNGLIEPWVGSVWCNPGYSDVMPWAKRLVEHRGPWCALLKLDPTTKWWSTLVSSGAIWAPFRKRIKFERPDKPPLTANFPSVLIWRDWVPSVELQAWLWIEATEQDRVDELRRLLNNVGKAP